MTAPIADLATYIDHTCSSPRPPAPTSSASSPRAPSSAPTACASRLFPAGAAAEGLKLAVVCGFPSGKHHAEVKAAEAALSVAQGADEIDMVIDVGAAVEGRYDIVEPRSAPSAPRLPPPPC